MPATATEQGVSLLLEASTAHLTDEDGVLLAKYAKADMKGAISIPGLRLVPHQFGWFAVLFYPDDQIYQDAIASCGMSSGFGEVVMRARALGVRCIDFDQDADELDGVVAPRG